MAKLIHSSGIGNENSILAMNRNLFNFKKELKSLFSKAMGGKDVQEKEERGAAAGGGNARQQIRDNDNYTKR